MTQEITKEIVQKTADLSKIHLTQDEIVKITDSFGPIFEMIDTINEVDITDDIQRNFTNTNTFRNDVEDQKTNFNNKEVIAEFPDSQDDYLKTKKIL
ncbi:hypothetical protein CSB11_02090 [Candidatus Campbellbacteria bacterium]|nr:MAG: hypothetical protein CSB11_02090 [Candidatus Campbellbacteria bacterium]